MGVRTFAAIDVGSFELVMKIFEFAGKNKIREIDTITRRLDLGSDTYGGGKIGPLKFDELCRTLKEFAAIMKMYKADAYKAYGTSAIREVSNTEIILDQIAQRTGIRLEVLSNSEQRFLDYKSIASKGEIFGRIIEDKTAIVDIGGGSIQISLFENDTLAATQNLRLGVLRVQERLNHLNVGSMKMDELVDEMTTAQLAVFKKMYLKDHAIKNIIVVDDYLSPWAVKMAGSDANRAVAAKERYEELMIKLHTSSNYEVAQLMDIPEEKAALARISAVILRRIVEETGAERIWAPGVTLCDGIAYEYAQQQKLLTGEHDFEKDILACAVNISKRYMGSRKRAETLEKIALTIFDSMKKVHGLGKRERLYLQLAAVLHDCGKYISMVNMGETSYNIIMATEMIGLSHREREIVANIVRYNHSEFEYEEQLRMTDQAAYLTVAKLTAILRLTNSLDRSHKQKMKGVKARLEDHCLILTVETMEDITLEKGFFEERADFFQEVFGIRPVLKQRKKF